MSCLSEWTCAVYADGELQHDEACRVARHLSTCTACRVSIDALRVESRILVHCLQDADFIEFELEDELLNAPQAHSLSVTRLVMFVLAMATLLRPVATALSELEWPQTLRWLNPLSAAGQVKLLLETAMYGIPAALNLADSFLRKATVVVSIFILLFAIVLLVRRSALSSALFSAIALLTVFSSSSYAIEVRRGDQPVTVPAGETIDDTLVVTGESVTVDGVVNGDLIAFVEQVRIRGTVKGNLISFADRIEIDGVVEGSVVGAGGWVETRGSIGRNLYALVGNVTIPALGRIAGNATFLAGESTLQGTIGRDFTAYSARSTGFGPFRLLGRGGLFQVMAPAHVGRNLSLKVDQPENARIDSGATIGGKADIHVPPPQPGKYSTASFYMWQAIWLAAALITGLIAFWLAPALAHVNLDTTGALLTSTGIGFLALVATPVAAMLVVITLIGLPLGLIALAAWVVACYLSKIVIAGFIGRSLLANQGGSAQFAGLALLAGLIPVFVAVNLPYVGGWINFLLTLVGLGVVVTTCRRMPWLAAPALSE